MFHKAPPGAPPLMEGTSTRFSSKAALPAAAPGAARQLSGQPSSGKKGNKEATIERKVKLGEDLARRWPKPCT